MKKLLFLTVLCFALCLMLDNPAWGQTALNKGTTTNISGTGTKTYYTPTGYKITKIEAWGAGGGGAFNYQTSSPGGGHGGGGGAYAAVSPTDIPFGSSKTISVTIGAGGNGGTSSSKTGVNGGPSYVSYGGTEYVRANFGYAGGNSSGAGGQGGSSAKGLSVTGRNGGSGGAPKYNSALGSWGMYSGGGGAGAGDSGNGASGNNASTTGDGGSSSQTSSNPGSNKGQGGQGGGTRKIVVTSNTQDATGGSDYGGGGGGTTHGTAGKGGNGFVRITTVACSVNVTYDANTTDAVTWNASTWGNSSTHSYGRTYDGNVSAFDFNAGSALSRSGYIFLGFYTAATGGTKVTYTTKITTSNFSTLTWNGTANLTGNLTLYAHWAYAGAIADGSTNITPCGDYTIFNKTAPDAVDGLTYSWSYSYNGGTPVELNKDYMQPTGTQLGLSLNQPGDYVFTRYVHALNQTVASDNSYTVHVAYSAGSITQATVDQVSGEPVEVTGTAVDNSVYRWKCNGTVISGATGQNLSLAANTVCAPGTYVYTREAKKNECDMEWVASDKSYTVTITEVNPGEIAAATKYLCPASNFTIGSETDASTTSSGTIVYEWRYSKDGGAETAVTNSNKKELTQDDITLSDGGTYVFKRYATIGCAEAVAATGICTLNVVTLSASYDAPTANYTKFCEGGTIEVTGDNYTLPGVTTPHNQVTAVNWMVSKDGAPAASAAQTDSYTQELTAVGTYTIYAAVEYFNDAACAVNTTPVTVQVVADPTIAVPSMSGNVTSICPNGEVTLTAASIVGGVGDGYTYNWEFMGATATDWAAISEAEATYNTTTGTTITASNFISTGNVQYRTYISNAQGCDAYSPAKDLDIITVDVPIVSPAMDVCPAPNSDTAFTTMVTTTDPTYLLRWFADATSTTEISAPNPTLENEAVLTCYVAQLNPDNGCLSARVPVTLTITYTAHLGHDNGELHQVVCRNSAMDAITFSHSGDCAPQVTFTKDGQDVNQIAGVTVTSGNGTTVIEGSPAEAGSYTFHVELHPDAQTVCAAPNSFDGSILVNPVYNVVDNQTICGGSYTISDQMGHSYSFTESGTYTKTLEAVTGCDSVVTLNLYVHEWNQFGYEENEVALATWTNFTTVSDNMASDGGIKQSGSRITYGGWNGSNTTRDNLTSTSNLVGTAGNSLGLINAVKSNSGCSLVYNNGKSIILKTNTKDYGNIKLHFDYELECTSATDHAFNKVQLSYGFDGFNFTNFPEGSISVTLPTTTTFDNQSGNFDLNLSSESSNAVNNADDLYIKMEFNGGARSIVDLSFLGCYSNYDSYFRIDNICVSGSKYTELDVKGENIACTNQPFTVEATPPYINTLTTPPDTTPVIYKWERIVNGASTELNETSNVLVDHNVPAGNYQYKVSVGEPGSPCGQSATIDVQGIEPAYHPEIVRYASVCSNKVDQLNEINWPSDCPYVDGMFIVTPSAEEMKKPGTYTCELSIPTTTNPCDSVITLMLDVLKALDTSIVANICLGETYILKDPNTDQEVFNITPTVEGITYHTSPAATNANGCDSIYRLTLITNSVRKTLEDETNVTLAAWPMDNGKNNFIAACGAKTTGSSFVKGASANSPTPKEFEIVEGHTPSVDYCYEAGSSNTALRWPNLFSECSGSSWFGGQGGDPTYTDYRGVYFEIKIDPYDYSNLKLKFDYKRDNASTSNAKAFDEVKYYYKFSESDNYNSLGTTNINSTNWASQSLDFSSVLTQDEHEMYLKVEFTGGNPGNTESCGTLAGSKYLPSYITVDNVMIYGDRLARATLNGPAQTCSDEYVCEGENVTFNCQGDDNYFKFYVVDETANDTTAFNGSTTLTKMPTQSSVYKIVAVEQTTMCDSIWGPFNVELIKKPTITYVSGSNDEGICGNNVFDIEISIEDADSYTFTWLTNGYVVPDGIDFSNNNGTITIGGVLTNGGSAKYYIEANPDNRCPTGSVTQNGTIAARVMPTFTQTLGSDTVCQGDTMQFVITNMDDLNFTLVPEGERFAWTTATATLSNKDTLAYKADEATHTARHYLTVKQNGCTTVDSVDIVVYDLDGDTLRLHGGHYVMNYGDIFLDADSLQLPDLMHNNEVIAENMIASITQSGGAKIYPNNMTDLTTTITWTITDQCGKEHTKVQTLTFELPPCGDADHFTVTDVDGNTYSTVRMGLNCWMRENLKTLNYADGTPVAKAMGYVNNQFPNADNTAAIFGRLYSWYSAMNLPEGSTATPTTNEFGHVQGVCPDGWFMPTPEYFMALHDIDMDHMRTNTYWLDGGGDNSTDFSILPGGAYNSDKDRFENILGNAYFWTTDLTGSGQPKTFMADCHCYMWQILDNSTNHGFSVRCVKDKEKNN